MILKNKKMRKGIGIGTIIGLILIAIVVFFMFVGIAYGPGLVDTLKRIIFGAEPLDLDGDIYETALTEAIRCAYYRCKEGCAYVDAMTWQYLAECPCSDLHLAVVCDVSAKLNPVEVFIERNAIISPEYPFDFIMLTPCAKTGRVRTTRAEENIGIDQNKIITASCPTSGTFNIVQGLCEVKAGKYFVWDEVSYDYSGDRILDSIIVCGESTLEGCAQYISPDECSDAGCTWCEQCDGRKVNKWNQAICVDPGISCEPYTCTAGSCEAGDEYCSNVPPCEDFDWNICDCVPGPCT